MNTEIEIEYTVDQTGNISSKKIIKGYNEELDQIVLDALDGLNDFEPGTKDGVPFVSYFFTTIQIGDKQ